MEKCSDLVFIHCLEKQTFVVTLGWGLSRVLSYEIQFLLLVLMANLYPSNFTCASNDGQSARMKGYFLYAGDVEEEWTQLD